MMLSVTTAFQISLSLMQIATLPTQLFLADPPGPPEIQGYMEGETIRLGQTVTLICVSHGGNPLAEIVWFKNDVGVDFSYTTSGRDGAKSNSRLPPKFLANHANCRIS